MQLQAAILTLSLGANLGVAQGTFHFEWYGNQNQIRGGFDTTYEEVMVAGTRWGSQVLLNSLSFTDFNGVVMNTKVDSFYISGGVYPSSGWWHFDIALVDWSRNVELTTYGDATDYLGRFQEQVIPGQFFGAERGYWTMDFVPSPEPSTSFLVALGLLAWLASRFTRR